MSVPPDIIKTRKEKDNQMTYKVECFTRSNNVVFAYSTAKTKAEADKIALSYGRGEQYDVRIVEVI